MVYAFGILASCLFLFAPVAAGSGSTDSCFLHDDIIFLVDVCCQSTSQQEILKSELVRVMPVFADPPNKYQTFRVGVYLYDTVNPARPEVVGLNHQTLSVASLESCNTVSCLQDIIRDTLSLGALLLTPATTRQALEEVIKIFPAPKATEVRRRTVVLVTSNLSNFRGVVQQSYEITNRNDTKLFVVGIDGSGNTSVNNIASNASVYVSNGFNCSTCQLSTDLRQYFNSSDHCPPEQHWCQVRGCDLNANCQWRYPFCVCKDGFMGNGTYCERLNLHEFWQGLTRDENVYNERIQSLPYDLHNDFYPQYPFYEMYKFKGVDIISINNFIVRYYVRYLGAYETVDTLLQRYAINMQKWGKYGSTAVVGMPQPVSCFHSYPNEISSYYFPNAQLNTISLSSKRCPQGFPAASIQCVPHNTSTTSGLVLGAKFDPSTLNTISCDASLNQIKTENLVPSDLQVIYELQLLTSGISLSTAELNTTLNIVNSIKTMVQAVLHSNLLAPHLVASFASSISNIIAGLKTNPHFQEDPKVRYSLVDTLADLLLMINMAETSGNVWKFKTTNLAVKVQDMINTNRKNEVYMAPRKSINNYNISLFPLNATLAVHFSKDEVIRTVFVYLNSSAVNKPDQYKQGLVYASAGKSATYVGVTTEVTVEMLDRNETYGRTRKLYSQNVFVRQQCVAWNSDKSDWLADGCCLDSSFLSHIDSRSRIICKCSGSGKLVSMRTTTTNVAPVVEHSLVTIIVGSIFCFVAFFIFSFVFVNKNARRFDVLYVNRMLCLVLLFIYLMYMFAVPCRHRFDLNRGWTNGVGRVNYEDGARYAAFLHFGILSAWLLFTMSCVYTTERMERGEKPLTCKRIGVFLLCFVVAGIVVAIDAVRSLTDLDNKLRNEDLCDPRDTRYLSSTYLSDNMCWISGRSFYVATFLCLLFTVAGCVWVTIRILQNKQPDDAVLDTIVICSRKNIIASIVLCLSFGVCCVFGQLLLVAVEEGTRQAMEIMFAISTCIFMLVMVWSMCVEPARKFLPRRPTNTFAMH